jgi:microsomal epoxide hydrolase
MVGRARWRSSSTLSDLPIRRLADRSFPNIVQWSEFDRGGHFAAMEQPDLFVHDLRSFAHAIPQ